MLENVTIGDLAFWESARTQNVTHVWIKVYAEVSCFFEVVFMNKGGEKQINKGFRKQNDQFDGNREESFNT